MWSTSLLREGQHVCATASSKQSQRTPSKHQIVWVVNATGAIGCQAGGGGVSTWHDRSLVCCVNYWGQHWHAAVFFKHGWRCMAKYCNLVLSYVDPYIILLYFKVQIFPHVWTETSWVNVKKQSFCPASTEPCHFICISMSVHVSHFILKCLMCLPVVSSCEYLMCLTYVWFAHLCLLFLFHVHLLDFPFGLSLTVDTLATIHCFIFPSLNVIKISVHWNFYVQCLQCGP